MGREVPIGGLPLAFQASTKPQAVLTHDSFQFLDFATGAPVSETICSTCKRAFRSAGKKTCLACLEKARSRRLRSRQWKMVNETFKRSGCLHCSSCKRTHLEHVDFSAGYKTCRNCLRRKSCSKRVPYLTEEEKYKT